MIALGVMLALNRIADVGDVPTFQIDVVDNEGSSTVFEIATDAEAPLAALEAALPTGGGVLHVDGRVTDPDETISSAGIKPGSTLSYGTAPTGEAGEVLLKVVAGWGTGLSWALPIGSHQVGRVLGAIRIDDPTVSKLHAEVIVRESGVAVRDLDSRNGTWRNDELVSNLASVEAGDVVCFGDVRCRISPPRIGDASLAPAEHLTTVFNRPGRFVRPRPVHRIEGPGTTPAERHVAFRWITLLSPALLALVALFVFQRPEMLFLAAVGPVAAVAQYFVDRRRARADAAPRTESADASRARHGAELRAALDDEASWAFAREPDPVDVLDTIALPDTRLWERRPTDDDFLELRAGVGEVASAVTTTAGDGGSTFTFRGPVSVDVRAAGVVGLAGDHEPMRSVARQLVARAAAYHAPSELHLVLLAPDEGPCGWQFVRWLPHAVGGVTTASIGTDLETCRARIDELAELVDGRTELDEREPTRTIPAVLCIADGAQRFRSYEPFVRVLRNGRDVGVYVLAIEGSPSQLPEETRAMVHLAPGAADATLHVAGHDPMGGIELDMLEASAAEQAARRLGPVVLSGGDASSLPGSIRLLDLEGVRDPSDVARRWQGAVPMTAATLGVDDEGVFNVDLQRDGPHALVAGTTGSGKTELLQTLLASLALSNPPPALSFLLVDYKGGGDFAEVARFPHTLGSVSNLDERLTQRAIVALRAEVERRQSELGELRERGLISEANVRAAWREQPDEARDRQLGRLVIVVDEFALFARNLQSFVEGLVQVTEQGRSLGMHLILSVQRPAGVVTGSIRANVGLRIVLRTERGESAEVLESPHADLISRRRPGRGFVRLGDPPRLVEFQAARIGGLRPDAAAGPPSVDVRHVDWRDLGRARPREVSKVSAGSSDLAMLSEFLSSVGSGHPMPTSPWPDPLPNPLLLAEVAASQLQWGLVDQPGSRRLDEKQVPLMFDPAERRNVAVVGSRGSGRGDALAALACVLATHRSPDELHLVPLDFSGAFSPLERLPHVGAVPVNDFDRFERYLELLVEEIRRRQAGLTGPDVVVLLNRYETVAPRVEIGSSVETMLHEVLRDGPLVGVCSVVGGDESLLSVRLQPMFEQRILLSVNDPSRYQEVGLSSKLVPAELPRARGFLGPDGAEVQLATAGPGLDPTAELQEAVDAVVARWANVSRTTDPPRVDLLPPRLDADTALSYPAVNGDPGPLTIEAGVGGDVLARLHVPLSATNGGFVVAGPRKSGKSTALAWMTSRLLARGSAVMILSGTGRGPVTRLADMDGVVGFYEPPFDTERLIRSLEETGGPVAIIVDDAPELLRRTRDQRPSPMAIVRSFVDARGSDRAAVIVAGELERLQADPREAIAVALNSSNALLFSPDRMSARAFGAPDLPSRYLQPGRPGRGVLIGGGTVVRVQVPDV